MQIARLFSLLSIPPVLAQFIAQPVAFNTADLFVAPTGTSVVTFGGSPPLTSPSNPEPTTTLTVVTSSSLLPDVPRTATKPSTAIAPASLTISVTSAAPIETSEASPSLPPTVSPALTPSSSVTVGDSGEEDVVTVYNTFYTTVPCTTTTTTTSSSANGGGDAVTPKATLLKSIDVASHEYRSTTPATSTTAAPAPLSISTSSPGAGDCAVSNAFQTETIVLHTEVTEVQTVRITQTHLVTVSL